MKNNRKSTKGKRWGIRKAAVLLSLGIFAGTIVIPDGEVVQASSFDYNGTNRIGETEMAMNNTFLYEWSPYRNEVILAGENYERVGHEYYSKDDYYTGAWKRGVQEGETFFIFGGYYENEESRVSIMGRRNPEEGDDNRNIYLLVETKDESRGGTYYHSDTDTIEPFVKGKTGITEYNDYLFIRTSHTLYGSQDGNEHQASMMLQYSLNNHKFTDSFTSEADPDLGFTELSLDQFVQMDGEKLIAVDHGAGNPRALTLYRYNSVGDGTFNKGASNVNMVKILTFPGEAGNEYTATYTGGMEVSSSAYLVAASSGLKNDPDTLTDPDECRNIFIGVVDKDMMTVTKKWLTDYAADDPQISIPRLVKITDDLFYVLWEQNDKVYYQQIDGNGEKVGLLYSMDGVLTDCQPTVIDGAITWFYRNYKEMTFYRIDLSDPSNGSENLSGGRISPVKVTGNSNTTRLHPGDQVQFTREYYPEGAECPDGYWNLYVDEGDKDSFSLDENGLLTVNKAGARCSVYYYLKDGTNEYGGVYRIESRESIQEMTLSKTEISLDVGETKELRFTISPEEGTWGAEMSNVGLNNVFSRDEELQTITGISPGKGSLTYTAADDQNRKVTCDITVYGRQEAPEELILKGKSYTSVSFDYEWGVEYSRDLENWQDSATFTGLEQGKEYSFYVRKKARGYYHESEPYGPVKVKTLLQVSEVSVEPDEVTLKEEEESALSLNVLPLAADNREIQWTSEKPEVAIITTNEEEQLVVRGLKYGETTITGKTKDGSDISVSVKVNVLEKEHAWDEGNVTLEPTCTATGNKHFVCTVCGEEKDETLGIDLNNHDPVIDKAVDPTCTETGLTKGSHCSRCSKILVEQQEIPAKGHAWDDGNVTLEPTCTAVGNKHFVCKVCEVEKDEPLDIEPNNHNRVIDEAVAPKCLETGLTEGSHCSLCGEVFEEQQVVPATGHSWDTGTVVVKPTALSRGKKKFTCINCDAEKTETYYSEEWVDGLWYEKDGSQTYKPRLSWHKNGKGWWVKDTSGWYPKNRWQKIDGKWYYFDKEGYMETNAYRGKSYLKSNGAWDEKALVGWKQTSVGWTYQLSGGAKLSGKWAKIDGNWYYFHKNGRMAANEWVNGYWFNANGTWTYKARGSWRKGVGGRWWYGDTSGWFAANGTYTIDGKK